MNNCKKLWINFKKSRENFYFGGDVWEIGIYGYNWVFGAEITTPEKISNLIEKNLEENVFVEFLDSKTVIFSRIQWDSLKLR